MTEILIACLTVFIILLWRIERHVRKVNERLNRFEKFMKNQAVKPVETLHHDHEFASTSVDIPQPVLNHDKPPITVEKTIFEDKKDFVPEKSFTSTLNTLFNNEEENAPVNPQVDPITGWWEIFKRKNPDLEKFVGENLISKIGIAILVLGIGFFVKYAIDKNWIDETARVGIGLLAGALVNLLAHRLRHKFKAFSSVLAAGAVAIYYFTIAIAFQEYHLFSQLVAFIVMVVITTFSLLLSVSYDRQELAVLSLIGGFATPLMVSTGQGNYIVLFTHLLILDAGILVLAYLRNWRIVNLCTYVFSMVFYLAWLYEHKNALPKTGALIYASAFYAVFVCMLLVNNLRKNRGASGGSLSLFLSNTAIYYTVGMFILDLKYQGLFTSIMAVVNLAIGWILYYRLQADRKLVYLLIGLALTFATLAAPVQLDGNHITLFWAAESVLLLWLSLRSELRNFLYASLVVFVLMLISLVIDWGQYYSGFIKEDLAIILNKICLTGLFACACLLAMNLLLKKQDQKTSWLSIIIDPAGYRRFIGTVMIVLLYAVGLFETYYQTGTHLHSDAFKLYNFCAAYHMLYCAALMIYLFHFQRNRTVRQAYVLGLTNILLYAVVFTFLHQLTMYDIVTNPGKTWYMLSYRAHFYTLGGLVIICIYTYRLISGKQPFTGINKRLLSHLLPFLLVIIASSELWQIVIANNEHAIFYSQDSLTGERNSISAYHNISLQIIKTGLPILWGSMSIIFLIYGIRRQNKNVRIFALLLQAITIIKLFTYDISNVSQGGKIVAFIILGIMLLIMSFMYQKIKALIFTDENN